MKALYISLAAVAVAAASSAQTITPLEAVDYILSRNGTKAQADLIRSAKDEEARGIANAPDPEIEGDYKVAPSGVDNKWGVGISYGIDWPGAYAARRTLGKAAVAANAAEAEAVAYAKRLEISEGLWSYLYADSRLDLMRHVEESTDSIKALAEKAARGGELSRLDLSKIAIEQSRLRSVIAAIEAEKLEAEGNLRTLNGGYDCRALLERIERDWTSTDVLPLNECLDGARRNPELMKAMGEYAVAEKNVSVAKAEALPGFKVGYSHEFEEGSHFNGASLGVSIPLFSSRHKVKAAEAAKAAAEFAMVVEADRSESQVTALYNEVAALDEALKTPNEIFSATDYPALLLKAYKGGELSLTDFLRDISWFYEAHMEYLDLRCQRERKAQLLTLMCK